MKRRDRRDRSRKPGAGARRRHSAPGSPRRRLRTVLGAGAAAALVVTAVFLYRLTIRQPGRPTEPGAVHTPQALRDSADAALATGRLPELAHWLALLIKAEPRNSVYLRALGGTLHNLAWGAGRAGRLRSATRTSLDRLMADVQALALLDSAAANAPNPEEWARSREHAGRFYETLGLPLDALQVYAEVRQRVPGHAAMLDRVNWIVGLLRDPLHPPRKGAPLVDVQAR